MICLFSLLSLQMNAPSVSLAVALVACCAVAVSAGDVIRRTRAVVAPGTTEYHFHFGNCLNNMTFIGCHDFVGTWAAGKGPTNITVNTAIDMTIEFPASGTTTGSTAPLATRIPHVC
jgi:hypothetical protein